ncbi:MAG: hypothetical protein FWD68_11755 [Alphaproteobacteria bacterium]|nr:hypothetical protein [Alphaproteobacteria bacterium]
MQILSNLVELDLEDVALLRMLGHCLVQAGRLDRALSVFERVLRIQGEEPQSRRDLALVADKPGQHQRAVDLLWEAASRRPWDDRFQEVGMIALGEMNAIVSANRQRLDLSKIDARLIRNMPVGLRVVVTWDGDNCDGDLRVDDPNGERAEFDHPLTTQGGRRAKGFSNSSGSGRSRSKSDGIQTGGATSRAAASAQGQIRS